jgi:hypothetical protein
MSRKRVPIAATAAAAFFMLLVVVLSCAPAVRADAPVVTYYYLPG